MAHAHLPDGDDGDSGRPRFDSGSDRVGSPEGLFLGLHADLHFVYRIAPSGNLVQECSWGRSAVLKRIFPQRTGRKGYLSARVHPEDLDLAHAHLSHLLEGRASVDELRIRDRSRTWRHLRVMGYPTQADDGQIHTIQGAVRDLTGAPLLQAPPTALVFEADSPSRIALADLALRAGFARVAETSTIEQTLEAARHTRPNVAVLSTTGEKLIQTIRLGYRLRNDYHSETVLIVETRKPATILKGQIMGLTAVLAKNSGIETFLAALRWARPRRQGYLQRPPAGLPKLQRRTGANGGLDASLGEIGRPGEIILRLKALSDEIEHLQGRVRRAEEELAHLLSLQQA